MNETHDIDAVINSAVDNIMENMVDCNFIDIVREALEYYFEHNKVEAFNWLPEVEGGENAD